MKKRPYFKLTDLIIIIIVLLVSVSGFTFVYFKTSETYAPATAQIRVNTQLVKTIELSKIESPYEITVDGNFPVTLEVSCDGVRFIKSECPDGLCIHSGLIEANESAACLPAGVSVKVTAEDKAEIDGIAG